MIMLSSAFAMGKCDVKGERVQPRYKRMIKKMQHKEESGEAKPDGGWTLYILRCKSDTFYTGVTKDLERRLKMHNDGKASRYTRSRRPVKLMYLEECESRAQALVRECKVKALSRKEKKRLISDARKNRAKGKTNG